MAMAPAAPVAIESGTDSASNRVRSFGFILNLYLGAAQVRGYGKPPAFATFHGLSWRSNPQAPKIIDAGHSNGK